MPVTSTRNRRCALSWTASMTSRSLPKSARVPVTNRTSLVSFTGDVGPGDLHVRCQVPARPAAEQGLVLHRLDLARTRALDPEVLIGEGLAGRDPGRGHHAGVGEVDGRLL